MYREQFVDKETDKLSQRSSSTNDGLPKERGRTDE
jgi:hypothetical protein